jgi:3-dehydroquinate synthase
VKPPFRAITTPAGRCDVFLGSGLLGNLAEVAALREATGIALLCDRNTDRLFRERVEATLRDARPFARASFPAGEPNKTLATAGSLLELLAKARLDRGCVIAAVGGGVVTDVAGFVASVYLRGVRWVAVPTTLLGMVDAAIGGKTGVDLRAGKNLAGSFHPPAAVVADLATLDTLPPRERAGGLAEVVKIAIAADPQLFEELERGGKKWVSRPARELESVIARAIEAKARLVEADERDSGPRLALNLGHTTGHALEAATKYQRFHHGEAVAIGIRVACELARARGKLGKGDVARIAKCLAALSLPVAWPADIEPESIRRFLMSDKKALGGALRVVLPTAIGRVVIATAAVDEVIAGLR